MRRKKVETDPDLLWPVLLDAVSRGQDVRGVNQGAAADVHVVVLLLLEDGRLPGIFPKLSVALLEGIGGVVDPAGYPVAVLPTTLTKCAKLGGELGADHAIKLLWLLPGSNI